jgi:hypothetical protein
VEQKKERWTDVGKELDTAYQKEKIKEKLD